LDADDRLRPRGERPDVAPNEKGKRWFDGIVGAAVAANELGATRPEFYAANNRTHRTISFAEASQAAVQAEEESRRQPAHQPAPTNGAQSNYGGSFSFADASREAVGGRF